MLLQGKKVHRAGMKYKRVPSTVIPRECKENKKSYFKKSFKKLCSHGNMYGLEFPFQVPPRAGKNSLIAWAVKIMKRCTAEDDF